MFLSYSLIINVSGGWAAGVWGMGGGGLSLKMKTQLPLEFSTEQYAFVILFSLLILADHFVFQTIQSIIYVSLRKYLKMTL